MIYQWNSAARIKANAIEAGKVFEALESTVGLTPKTLLEASRPKEAVLHNEFEWDDSKAAESYREAQASYIIRSLCIVSDEFSAEPVRAVFIINKEVGYQNTVAILSCKDDRENLLKQAKKELDVFIRKYNMLSELASVFDAVNSLNIKNI